MSAAAFLSELVAREIDEIEGIDELTQALRFYSELLDLVIEAPAGFRTDYASTPRLPVAYWIVGGKGRKAAVIHDWLYSGGLEVTRLVADQVLREALLASGYSRFTAALMYAGVRIGGQSHFNQPNLRQPVHVAQQIRQAPVVNVAEPAA